MKKKQASLFFRPLLLMTLLSSSALANAMPAPAETTKDLLRNLVCLSTMQAKDPRSAYQSNSGYRWRHAKGQAYEFGNSNRQDMCGVLRSNQEENDGSDQTFTEMAKILQPAIQAIASGNFDASQIDKAPFIEAMKAYKGKAAWKTSSFHVLAQWKTIVNYRDAVAIEYAMSAIRASRIASAAGGIGGNGGLSGSAASGSGDELLDDQDGSGAGDDDDNAAGGGALLGAGSDGEGDGSSAGGGSGGSSSSSDSDSNGDDEDANNPDDSNNPDNPNKPNNPDSPSNPSNPSNPNNPDSPSNPSNPDSPNIPSGPDNPNIPGVIDDDSGNVTPSRPGRPDRIPDSRPDRRPGSDDDPDRNPDDYPDDDRTPTDPSDLIPDTGRDPSADDTPDDSPYPPLPPADPGSDFDDDVIPSDFERPDDMIEPFPADQIDIGIDQNIEDQRIAYLLRKAGPNPAYTYRDGMIPKGTKAPTSYCAGEDKFCSQSNDMWTKTLAEHSKTGQTKPKEDPEFNPFRKKKKCYKSIGICIWK